MSRTIVIARRELSSYFFSPIAYVAMVVFLLICGGMFWNDFSPGEPAAMRTMFDKMINVLVFVIPLLCMGLLAQEWATGTIETMMTAPISETNIVLGKFFGSFGFLVILLIPTLLYVVLLRIYGRPDIGPIVCGYLGILLVGAMFISVALFCSSLTRSQIVAAVAAAAILTAITIVPWLLGGLADLSDFARKALDQMVYRRYTDFSRGVIDTGNVVFFVVSTAVFLFFTVKVLESRRWK
ncbi:MAG TPA: ABC transporter permease [Tepidisphaeraceae bacterium]|jgi:ABC-2 type transport system permease protein|nr:ABC transporter permease [Tepidisphaeraceae bacterium]